MKYSFLFILYILWVSLLPMQAQTAEKDSSIYIVSSDVTRMGESMVISMQVDITRSIAPNEAVVLVPRLQDSLSNFVQLPSIYVNGKKQHIVFKREKEGKGESYEAIRRENNMRQTVAYLHSVPFRSWMRNATLSLVEKECGCGVPHRMDSTHVTTLRILPDLRPHLAFVTPEVEEVKLRKESGSAFLDFPLSEVRIYREYKNNATELQKIMNSIDLVNRDTNVVISYIDIHGYASPEGPYANNERLACERTRTLKEYVCSQYMFSDTLFTTRHTAEDWEGLARLLNDSLFDKQRMLLRIVNSTMLPDQKEREMRKQAPQFFEFMLNNWLPVLRHSDYTIHYVVRPFTVEQAKEMLKVQPKNLSIEEIFRIAQTYKAGSIEYNHLFMTAVLLNPDHPIANLNAACIALTQKDTVAGALYLEKSPECAEKTLAIGVLHLLKGEYAEAEAKLREAEEAGLSQATENIKQLYEIY